MKLIDLYKLNKWVEKIISYPGIDKEELALRKDYWVGGVVCLVIIFSLTLGFWMIHPEFEVLISYGLFMTIVFLLYPIAGIVIHRNLEGMMFVNQVLMIIGTFICVMKLGGVAHSGGLILVGFFVLLYSLDFRKKRKSIWLFAIYMLTLVLAWIFDPYLTVAPEMTPSANSFLFIFNLIWISALAFGFLLNFISQLVQIEQKEAKRLKEWDETKTKLYTNITHEFRTPLTVIMGMAELIRSKPEKWLHKGSRKIENNGEVLLNLVNQMLDLSKLEAGAMPVNKVQGDIISYIRYLIELFHSMADEKKITLQYFPETDKLIIDYDPDKLMQIISNLVSNALKYTEPGGQVEVITLITNNEEQKLEIRVKDNGMGIKEDHLPQIFNRFYRVDNDCRNTGGVCGSGLGLALTRELVKLLDGTINAESIYGQGSKFIVSLPVTNNASLKEHAELSKIEENISAFNSFPDEKNLIREETGQKDKPRLLIVEDSIDVIEYLQALLETNFNVQIAVNGKEGWGKVLELGPEIILSDIMMPEMDGIELLDKVKNDVRTSHIPVIILTAKADIASRLTGLEKGADAYLAKPFNEKELIIQLNRVITLREKLQERYANIGQFVNTPNKEYKIEDSFIRKIREFILANLDDENLDIKKLCNVVAMSRTQLYHKFKSLTNRTIFEYLQSLRLLKAKELLLTSDINVSEAAYQTGFKNLSHFSRAFTKEFGVNPSKIQN
ncbi:MAG: ATP-binding protein [Bacteroidota bacterium]